MIGQMPLPWPDGTPPADDQVTASVSRARTPLALLFVRNSRARRYILRVLPDARVRVTIPRYGSRREAEAFVRTRLSWIADRQTELEHAQPDKRWSVGTMLWWRGERMPVLVHAARDRGSVRVSCGDLTVATDVADDYRVPLESMMRKVAVVELPPLLHAIAARHGLDVSGVSVRNQRSRWGSCSQAGRIALNWRLMQMPDAVREYVLLHELMHLREPNHSPRFWALVADACPAHRSAREWLKREGLHLC